MSNETPVEPITDDLDAFTAELFGQSKAEPEQASSEAEDTEVEDSDAQETQAEEDTLETEDEDETEEEANETPEEEDEKPEPKKSRFQKRIDELTAAAKEAERREQETLKRFEALEAKLNQPKDEKTPPVTEATGPAPDDTNEDGTEKYPLGEWDPSYIRDYTKFTLQQEREAMRVEEAKASEQKRYEAEKTALQEGWTEKLGPARERYPDFNEKGQELFGTFDGIDQTYGEYLTAALMSMDYGPDVLYYLANNLDEANKIVASGPTKATIALGRLESKFADAEAEKQKARPKVSKAPAPPAQLKGTNAVMDVPDDTDDLDAFSKKLFKKK